MAGFGKVLGFIPQILSVVFQNVVTAERFFGSKTGPQKREAALDVVMEDLKEATNGVTSESPARLILLLLANPKFRELLGTVIDSLVALLNFVKEFEDMEGPAPPTKPRLIQ